MVRYVILALLPFLAIFFQSTLFSFYSIRGTIPDLVLMFVVFFALINGERRGTIYGFLCGLLEDLYMGRLIGLNALCKAIVGYSLGKMQGNVFKENMLVGVLGVLAGTIINSLVMLILIVLFSGAPAIENDFFVKVLFQCLYNLLLSVPVYFWFFNSSYNGVLKA
ncbi:MAG: rod shape-determining protein MreD [Syntrophomonadaceae bacterium]|nr:rod shape-determining protein MreD [Syntrophomonadaceae bacterium]